MEKEADKKLEERALERRFDRDDIKENEGVKNAKRKKRKYVTTA